MNNPNPLIPQGSLQGQPKGKSNFRIAVFTIVAIHVVLICGFLIQGCKPDSAKTEQDPATNEVVAATKEFQPLDPTADPNTAPISTNGELPNGLPPSNSPNAGLSATGAVVAPPVNNPTGSVAPTVVYTNPGVTPNTFTSQPPVVADSGLSTPGAPGTTHKVAKGEILSRIAPKYGVSVRAIEEANPGLDATKLKIGQEINIPAGATSTAAPTASSTNGGTSSSGENYTIYTVKSGDVLSKIASRNNTTVRAIKEANGLKLDRINAGQKLKIPKKS